jgi:O-antigen ligase
MPRPLLVAFLLFGLWGLASCLWAGSLLDATYRWTSMLQMIGFAFLIVQLADSALRLSILIVSNLIGALIAAGFAYHNFVLFGASDPALRTTAFVGTGSVDAQNADNYPILLSLGAAFCLVRAVTSRGPVRLPWTLGAAILTMAALLSGTRSFVVGFGAAVLVLALLLRRERRIASRAFLAMVVALVTIVSVATLPSYIVDRVSTAPSALFNSSDLGSGRVEIWGVYLRMIARNPVVGVGIGNGPYAFPAYAATGSGVGFPIHTALQSEESLGSDPHSDIVMVLAELGVVGLGLFVLFVWMVVGDLVRSLLSVSYRSRLWPLGLATAMYLTTVLIAGLVDPKMTKKMWWLAVGLALAFPRLAREEPAVSAAQGDRDPS